MQAPFNALYIPANPHREASVFQLYGPDDPEVERLIGARPSRPATYDFDAGFILKSDRMFTGESLNERATAWVREQSAARRTFTATPEHEYFLSGNVLVVGYTVEGGEETFSDVPDRIVSYAMSCDHDELVEAHRARLVKMRGERRDARLVAAMDPAARAADLRGSRTMNESMSQDAPGEIAL